MRPAFYLYEPAIMKMQQVQSQAWIPENNNELLGILLEDYFLPQIQARALNPRKEDQSGSVHYFLHLHWKALMEGNLVLDSHDAALEYIELANPKFIIKTNESQHYFESFTHLFPEVKIFHIVRNGFDVVSSSVARGWYTNRYMEKVVDYVTEDGMPWFWATFGWDYKDWKQWNPATRAASVWISLMRASSINTPNVTTIKYEYLAENPRKIVRMLNETCGLEQTDITIRHMYKILSHHISKYPSILDIIAEPVRSEFIELNGRHGYET
jgi:hypothetical protein